MLLVSTFLLRPTLGFCTVQSDDLTIGGVYYFGVPFDSRVHSGKLLKVYPKDRLEPSAELCDLEGVGRYVTVPITIMSENKKEAQQKWKKIYSTSKRGKFALNDVTN